MLAQTPVQFSYGIPGTDTARIYIIIGVTAVIYGFIGWMISYSKQVVKNLAFAQAATMLIWILGSVINDGGTRVMFLTFYSAVLISLAMGFYAGRIGRYVNISPSR